mmetsp:Transcript_72162/g.115041  ORF Transcript_72162/g.115041 Transcript_72162/m.115041 type:complete len:176 (+) Transcript_72162:127-654(+)
MAEAKTEELGLGPLYIYGAVYGKADVTTKCREMVGVKSQTLSGKADNETFGDSWPKFSKTLVIAWGYGKAVQTSITREGGMFNLNQDTFKSTFVPPATPNQVNLLSAVYGVGEYTAPTQKMVKELNLSVVASNDVFADNWPKITKTLVVVYMMGVAAPTNICVKFVQEGQTLTVP